MSKRKKKTMEQLLEEALVPKEEQPYEVPENWVWVRLGKIVKFIGGGTPSKANPSYWNGDIPWVSVKDIKGVYIEETQDTITQEGLSNSSSTLADENELLLITRMSPGKSAITKIKTAINQDLKIVRPMIDIPPFLLWIYFTTQLRLIEFKSTGSTVKGIRIDRLNELLFPISPKDEQKRIADKVERLLNKIDEAKQLIEEAKETFELRRAAILDKAFRGGLGTNNENEEKMLDLVGQINDLSENTSFQLPSNWIYTPFNSVISISSGNALTKSNMNEDGGIPVFGGNGITGMHDESNVADETLVVGRVGFYCGSVHLTPKKAWVTDNAFKVSYSEDIFDKKFLYWQLKNMRLRKYSNSSAQPVISKRTLKDAYVLIPPLNEQKMIARKLEYLFNKLGVEQQLIEDVVYKVNLIKQSILSKAFSGELGTNDPTEESAMELLKEVLQEQQK